MSSLYIKGLDKLSKELHELTPKIARKILRQSVSVALTPTLKSVKLKAPVGHLAHRTYKGRLVAPGFLSRNIKKSTKFYPKTGRAIARISVVPEAWYGMFYDTGFNSKFDQTEWMTETFISDRRAIEMRFEQALAARLEK